MAEPMRAVRYRVWFITILAAAFAWRLVYVYVWGRTELAFNDGLFFHLQGRLLADGKGYLQSISYFYLAGRYASAAHPPLFPTVLGAATRIVRIAGFTGNSARFHEVVCACISTGAVAAIGAAARRLAGDRAGLTAAAIAAALPALWMSDAVVMSETMVALVVALFVLQMLRYRARPTLLNLALLAVAAGAAALTRSELVLLFPVIVVALAITGHRPPRRAIGATAVAVACFAVVLAPWMIRNAVTFTRPVFLSTNDGSMVAGANCDAAYSGALIGGWVGACQGAWPRGDESVVSATMLHRGLHYARHHTGRIPIVVAARLGRTFEVFHPFDDTEDGSRLRWVAVANTVTFFPLQVVAGLGIWKLRRRRIPVWPFLAILAVVVVTTAAGYGVARFRVPWDVAATVLAGAAVLRLPAAVPDPAA